MKTRYTLLSTIVACCCASISSADYDLVHTFDDPTALAFDSFGGSTAVAGDYVLVGAYYDRTQGFFTGQAHLYDAVTGDLLRTFDDPTVTSIDTFGASVAIDGNHALIGAPGDDTQGTNAGQAHLYNAANGSLLHTFDSPSVTKHDGFGFSVAIKDEYVLVGAPGRDGAGSWEGGAYLFDTTTGELRHSFYDSMPEDDGKFGQSVAVDGNSVLIGRSGDQVHLFDAVSGNLVRTFNDPTTGGVFGATIAIDGNLVLVGESDDSEPASSANQAHLFDADTGALLHTFDDPATTGQDAFGISVDISGNHVLIGDAGDSTNGNGVGQTHLFDAVTGSLVATFDDPTATGGDRFGESVAIDGSHVVVGAPGDNTSGYLVGQAHLFDIPLAALGLQAGMSHYGVSAPMSLHTTAVPEPSTALLVTGMCVLLTCCQRRVVATAGRNERFG